MNKLEQLKFVCIVVTMSAGVAYSYGMFTVPTPSLPRRNTSGVKTESKEIRTETANALLVPRSAALEVLHSGSTNSENS